MKALASLQRAIRRMPKPVESADLRAEGVKVHFDGVHAVDGVDLSVNVGEILGLIGPNGAGKTTLVNVLTGFQRPTAGRVWVGEQEVTAWPAYRFARMGLARTFQGVRVFPELSVMDNVTLGALGVGAKRREARRNAETLLEEMRLGHLAPEPAGFLSHGDARRVGILRALATKPSFLLLDEAASGLSPSETDGLITTVADIPQRLGCGVLVIEHDMKVIMSLSDRVQVLDDGQTVSIGTPTEIRTDEAVIAAYLGAKRAKGGLEG